MTRRADFPGLDAVLAVVDDVAAAFVAEGLHLYLVGGVVRDLALGSHARLDDIDLTTDAEPQVIKRLVKHRATALWTQGERFGTIGATINGRDLEITTHRAEAYDHTTRNPTVVFGTSIVDDLTRRDFTINAMAISLPDLTLVDPFGGLDDLHRRRLTTPLSPEESFSDDPLRMLRAARFVPRFDLTVDEAVESAAAALAGRLEIVSVERIQGEIERLLGVERPVTGLQFAERTGLLGHVIAEYGIEVGGERAVALASAATMIQARRAALLEPLDPLGSFEVAAAALRRLRYSKAATRQTLALLRWLPVALDEAPEPVDVRRVAAAAGADELVALADLALAVRRVEGQNGPLPFATAADAVARSEDLTDLTSPLAGREIIEYLGVRPGPHVGRAAAHLEQLRIEHGPMSAEQARAALDEWWAANGDGLSAGC